MPKVAVVIIHGMGQQKRGFSNNCVREINDRLVKNGKSLNDIAWKEIYWADVIEPRQKKFMQSIISHKSNDIDCVKLRRFVISALGDASAYQNIGGKKSSTYTDINDRVKECIKELNTTLNKPCPLIIMAHSLGGHIMSSYIWDLQKEPVANDLSDFEKMKYLAGMITFGCNIPLFAFAHNAGDLQPIKFPGSKLTTVEKSKAAWLNFYDPDDVLGYPLAQLNSEFKFIRDEAINSGGWFTSWNPLSHNGYWTDNNFTKPAASLIAKFM